MPQCLSQAQAAWKEARWCRIDLCLKNHESVVNKVAVQHWQSVVMACMAPSISSCKRFWRGLYYSFTLYLTHVCIIRSIRLVATIWQAVPSIVQLFLQSLVGIFFFFFVMSTEKINYPPVVFSEAVKVTWRKEIQKPRLIKISLLTKFSLAWMTLLLQ